MIKNNGYLFPIDVLRAIAVSLVVLFHANVPGFKGGFVGVDVFYVISGFLITLHIIKEKEQGKFLLSQFYMRRIARILPAALVTILVTQFVAYFVLAPADLERLGKSSLYASLSVSNIFFWLESGYFAQASALKPLLHTWSLSVEEQFYLVWPSLILLAFAFGKRTAVTFTVVLLSLLSFCWAYSIESQNADAVFFLMPFRVFQFGVGAFIALASLHQLLKVGRVFFLLLASAGLIFSASFYINHSDSILIKELLPAIFAGIFIIGTQSKWFFQNRLTYPFIWIGQRSYSIYLVHWPIIVLWNIYTDYELDQYEKLCVIIASVLLGYLLHRYVEQPFRFKPDTNQQTKSRTILTILLFLIVSIVSAAHFWGSRGYPNRIPEKMRSYALDKTVWSKRQSLLRHDQCNIVINVNKASDYDKATCLAMSDSKPNWLVLGDSYASGAYAIFKHFYPDVNFAQLTIPGCILRPSKRVKDASNPLCINLQSMIYTHMKNNKQLDGVVISSNWQTGHIYALEEIVKALKADGKQVVVINQRIRFKEKLPSIMAISLNKEQAIKKANILLKKEQLILSQKIQPRLSELTKTINMVDLQCPNRRCELFDDHGKLLYADDSHFSYEGIFWFGSKIKERYPNIFRD